MALQRAQRGFLLLLVIALFAIVPIAASAQTDGDVKRAEGQVDSAKENTSAAYDRWQQAHDDVEDALLDLERVTSELDNLTYTIGLLDSRIASYEADVEGCLLYTSDAAD